MKINEVIEAFYKSIPYAENKGCSISTNCTGNKLFSYSTCIAQRLSDGRIIKNITRYSNTTSKHQYGITKFDMIVNNVPIDSKNLINYLKA